MHIRTKIVATIGPASGEIHVLRRMIEAGLDVCRVNFSHGSDEQRQGFLENIRQAERDSGEPVAVMADLCGPKIRVGPIHGGSVLLVDGQEITIQREPVEGDASRISITRRELIDEVAPGEVLLVNDGQLRLEVVRACPPDEVLCRVTRGGLLSGGKGVNLPHTKLRLSALTEKDRRDVDWIAPRDFDYVALSFVRGASDIRELRRLLDARNSAARIVAKIEKPQAVENIDEILREADVVMVARGDLGVEMDLPCVPVTQKRLAMRCQRAGKPCIIATQMLETMTTNPVPTRAEVSDVANAVLDRADAVMLSGETAVGEHPVGAVRMMNEIVRETQAYHDETYTPELVGGEGAPATTRALARAVHELLHAEPIAAVAVYTASGATARMLAKNRLPRPVLAMVPTISVARRLCMDYGVRPVVAEPPEHTRDVLALAGREVIAQGMASEGEKIVVLSGRPIAQPGATNTLVVHTLPIGGE